MLGASNGLRELRVHRVYRSALASNAQYRHFIASSSVASPVEAATPEAKAAEVAAKKTGRATYWFIGVAAAAVIATLAYPQLVTLPPPPQRPASPLPLPVTPPTIVPPEPPVSPREQLNQRLKTLKTELAELRKEKRNQLVDMKKAVIKDEIRMIESGIAKLEKA